MRFPDDEHLLPLLVPEGGYPTCEENSSEKKNARIQGVFSKPQ